MSIPLAQLYHFYDDIVSDDLIIYRFDPPGSRKLQDLQQHYAYSLNDVVTLPVMICHDQEPLNFDLYSAQHNSGTWRRMAGDGWPREFEIFWEGRNLRSACEVNIHDRCLLLHSEQRGQNLEFYQAQGFEPVYVWSHGILARDWYRYAAIDPKIIAIPEPMLDFNIYARAWTGTREYRLKLLAMIADIGHRCRVTFSTQDQDTNYLDYVTNNPAFNINKLDLENLYGNTVIDSTASASYSWQHRHQCAIDVVTETLFDDDRLHLTEKSLRPMACAQPFIMVGPWGSLEYLRGYGFETFGDYVDESYDCIKDPVLRLKAVAKLMHDIARMSTADKSLLYKQLYKIARNNQQHFFGGAFFKQIVAEYSMNIREGLRIVKSSQQGTEWSANLKLYQQYPGLHSDIVDLKSTVDSLLDVNAAASIVPQSLQYDVGV